MRADAELDREADAAQADEHAERPGGNPARNHRTDPAPMRKPAATLTTVLKMPPAVPAASSTIASENFIRSKDRAAVGRGPP